MINQIILKDQPLDLLIIKNKILILEKFKLVIKKVGEKVAKNLNNLL